MFFNNFLQRLFFLFFFICITFTLTAFTHNTLKGYNAIAGDSINVEFLEIKIKCITSKENNFIINDEKEYLKLRTENLSNHPECVSYKFPEVNFNSNTLVGIITGSGGCKEPEIFINIIKKSIEKAYIAKILVKQNGLCKIGFTQEYWLLIPKIEKDYSVKFLINKQ